MRMTGRNQVARTQRGPAGRKVRPSRESIVHLVIRGAVTCVPASSERMESGNFGPDRSLCLDSVTLGIVEYLWENASRNPHTTGRSKTLLRFTRMVPYPYLHLPTFHNPSSVCVPASWRACMTCLRLPCWGWPLPPIGRIIIITIIFF